jgi:membrane-associated phospholipid phosphatase
MYNKILFFFLISNFSIFSIAYSQNFDINTVKSINQNASTSKTKIFKADANSVTVFNIAAPAGVFLAGVLKHNTTLKKDAAYIVGAYILSSIVTQGTKHIVNRARPYQTYSYITRRAPADDNTSFPSGHTSSAFCTATSLSLYFPKWYVIAPAYLWASSVGYARMYQGVHYPSDIFVGAIVGASSAWLGYKAQKWMDKKHKKTTNTSML